MAEPIIEIHNLTHMYGERKALDNISLTIYRGEIFGFLGPNGGGKTTIFKILSTLFKPTSGDVRIFGLGLQEKIFSIRARIGVVFQSPSIDKKLTVEENLLHQGPLYGLHGLALHERVSVLLNRFNLTDRARDLTEKLSGGLRRRVELAKGLLHRPELLILDEPSTGLDPGARKELTMYLAQLREQENCTVLLTTHIMEEAEACDRLAIIDEGQLITVNSPRALKSEIGGDIIVVKAKELDVLSGKIQTQLGYSSIVIDDTLHIEHPRGHTFIPQLVESFTGEIESVMLSKPTLEDVFIAKTGHKFRIDTNPSADKKQQGRK